MNKNELFNNFNYRVQPVPNCCDTCAHSLDERDPLRCNLDYTVVHPRGICDKFKNWRER